MTSNPLTSNPAIAGPTTPSTEPPRPVDVETIDFSSLILQPISTSIEPSVVAAALSKAPFLPVPKALNLRTISHPPSLRPGLFFRSGFLSHLPLPVLETLSTQHGIATIFDLRRADERARMPSPQVNGIENVWLENPRGHARLAELGAANHLDVGVFIEEGGRKGYRALYATVMDVYRDVWEGFFRWVIQGGVRKGGVVYHCTGKDRTGVLSAMLLSLSGAPVSEIGHDYALTRIGTEPFRDVLLNSLMKEMKATLETPGMVEMCGCHAIVIEEFLDGMDQQYAAGESGKGVERYLVSELGFTEEEVALLKAELRGTT